jgi:glycosyltransferase involved in cell wall biosynthesis
MIVIFIHQNFPAQYVHLARYLAQQPQNRVFFITQAEHNELPGVVKLVYKPDCPPVLHCHPYTATFDMAVRTGIAVAAVCRQLREQGIVPDIMVGHCGWGEMLFVKDVYPEVPALSNFEYFYHPAGADVGFDPEFAPVRPDDQRRLHVRNTLNRLSFASCDWGHTATAWQRSLFPLSMQPEISLMHEGVDTSLVRPDSWAWLKLAREEIVLTRDDEVVTYVARNLEPYRGFHVFMRALPEILRRRPRAHILIVGGDGISYGEPPPRGGSYRQMMLSELGDRLDNGRVHFLGHVPYDVYLNVLQVSSVHVYLSYPFVLSWSFIEAMAAGCLLLASATAPVLEVLRDRQNGLAVDFFSCEEICDRIDEVFEHPDRMQAIRAAARTTAIEDFDLDTRTLPRWLDLLGTLANGQRPAGQPPSAGLATRLGLR